MSIFSMIYNELQARIEHLPKQYGQYRSLFDSLDHEWISDIILDGNTFWFEWPTYGGLDEKDHELLIEYLKNKGYKYLYEGATK